MAGLVMVEHGTRIAKLTGKLKDCSCGQFSFWMQRMVRGTKITEKQLMNFSMATQKKVKINTLAEQNKNVLIVKK